MGKYIVTGGGGFLGSYLCERLLAEGHEVLCVDNFYSGSRRNIAHLAGNASFRLLEHDITEPLATGKVDGIFNLACPASPVHYQRDAVATIKTCVCGSANMLDIARKYNAFILQASTSEVYGDPEEHPQKESYWGNVNPNGIRSCYDEGKRCAESLFLNYNRQYGVRTKIVRIFNTYGPRMHPQDGRVVSNFIIQALCNRKLTLYGDGSQTRSFCYRDDLIGAILRMAATEDEITGPVNIGNPGEFTIRQLAELVIELSGSRSSLEFLPLPADDPKQRRPDISKAEKILDWKPVTPLREGLTKTIEYFDSLLKLNPEFMLQ